MTEAEQVRVLRAALQKARPAVIWAVKNTRFLSEEEGVAYIALSAVNTALKATGGE